MGEKLWVHEIEGDGIVRGYNDAGRGQRIMGNTKNCENYGFWGNTGFFWETTGLWEKIELWDIAESCGRQEN